MFDELDVLRTTLILTVLFFLAGLPFQLSIAMGVFTGRVDRLFGLPPIDYRCTQSTEYFCPRLN